MRARLAMFLCACTLVADASVLLTPNGQSFFATVRGMRPRSAAPCLQQGKRRKRKLSKATAAMGTAVSSLAVLEADETPAVKQARTALLSEIVKEQRSMETIASALATLEGSPSPAKLKRAMVGDWKLVFASDGNALAPFATGASAGPFTVLEDIYHRIESLSVQSLEVTRKIGPFGNSCNSLHGRWSFVTGDENLMSWKVQYMLDERGREVNAPGDGVARRARASHVSSSLLVLRPEAEGAAQSYAIFSRLGTGQLKKELDGYSVGSELFLPASA